MDTVSSLSFELSETLDRSGGTHPLGELSVRFETAPIREFPDEIAFTRGVYTFEFSFVTALGSVPKFLAGDPARVFILEMADWWALPSDEETVYFVWKQHGGGDNRLPTPVGKRPLADALVAYCVESPHFDASDQRSSAALELARESIQTHDSAAGIPKRRLRGLRALAWFKSDGAMKLDDPEIRSALRDPDTLEMVLESIRNCEDAVAITAYERLFEAGDYRRDALDYLADNPDPRLLDGVADIVADCSDEVATEITATIRQVAAATDCLEALDERLDSPYQPPLVQFFLHDSSGVRREITRTLAHHDAPWARYGLEERAEYDEDERVRQIARERLAAWDQ